MKKSEVKGKINSKLIKETKSEAKNKSNVILKKEVKDNLNDKLKEELKFEGKTEEKNEEKNAVKKDVKDNLLEKSKNEVILKVENVSYRYSDANKDDYILKNLNYEFETGKVYAIKGKSGSGKTTLLSLISGLEKEYEGSINFDGKELRKLDLDKYRSRDIGIIFQSYNLLPHLTAMENIILSMNVSKLKISNKEEKALLLMKSVGLNESQKNRRVLKLSGGEQQRVAIARSLSYNPKMILADEPTGNLDKETENEILKILIDLAKKENKCIIIVTHSENVCNKVDIVYELKKEKVK